MRWSACRAWPVGPLGQDVQRGEPLEHDSLVALLAGGGQQHLGLAGERGRYLHGAGDRQAEILQQGAAQHIRAARQVIAAGSQLALIAGTVSCLYLHRLAALDGRPG